MIKPFFISPPRTRSTVLFETMRPYVLNNTDLLPINGHTELFLHTSRNMHLVDGKTRQSHETELYPIVSNSGIDIHYVYPWIYKDEHTSVTEKLKLLDSERQQFREYFIKGTINLHSAVDQTLDFYKDYRLVFTLRRNVVDMVISVLVAYYTKIFHARNDNIDLYKLLLDEGITVDTAVIQEFDSFISKISTIHQMVDRADAQNLDYVVSYYEDLNTQESIDNCITSILETDQWKQHAARNLPIKVDKDYSKVVTNYDEVATNLERLVKRYGL